MPQHNNGSGDALAVPVEALAQVLEEWIASWTRDRPYVARVVSNYELDDRPATPFMSPETWLSEKTGLDKKVFRLIKNRETKFMTLSRADLIITAIGATHLLGSRIPIVANPRWSQEKWIAWLAERGCEPNEILSD